VANRTSNFRRHAARLGISAGLLAASLGIAAAPASADQLSTLKAEAQDVANQITTLGNQEEVLSEQYDAANISMTKDRQAVANATKAVAAAEASTARAKKTLINEAINAYTHNGTSGATSAGNNSMNNANNSLLRAEYISTLAAGQTDAEDAYRVASLQDEAAKQRLQTTQAAARSQVDTLAADRHQVMSSQTRLEGIYHQETGQIATLVAQIQAQQQAAAKAAAAAAAAAQQQAQQQAQQAAAVSGPNTSSGTTAPPATPPASGVGAAAVAAAETQVGVPYVWGGETPGVGFDCSGLVEWAYAQVGISLPHYSGAQFDAGVQISMSDLEPGDLVFYSNPGDHVAMYVGNGDIIEAPTYGMTVHIVPMYSEFVQAVRIS